MTITAPASSVVEVKGLCSSWSAERVRRLMGRHGFLTADQKADLRLMRWNDEARILGDPDHVNAMAATHDGRAVRVLDTPGVQ